MNSRAKAINLLMYDGSYDGVVSAEDSSWNSGELYRAPRSSVFNLLNTDAVSKAGVYLLLSPDTVYVGQSSDLAKRLNQHLSTKDWWESVVVITTKDDGLTHTDIDYLESRLIDMAFETGSLDCDNKQKGSSAKVDKYREVPLNQFLEEALFLMRVVGVTVFPDPGAPSGNDLNLAGAEDLGLRLQYGKGAKREAIEYLRINGVSLKGCVSYAVLQAGSSSFWLNPQVQLLADSWHIILNDNGSRELIVLDIPAGALWMMGEDGTGLIPRSDRPERIDLNIDRKTLIDRRSQIDFSPFLQTRVSF